MREIVKSTVGLPQMSGVYMVAIGKYICTNARFLRNCDENASTRKRAKVNQVQALHLSWDLESAKGYAWVSLIGNGDLSVPGTIAR